MGNMSDLSSNPPKETAPTWSLNTIPDQRYSREGYLYPNYPTTTNGSGDTNAMQFSSLNANDNNCVGLSFSTNNSTQNEFPTPIEDYINKQFSALQKNNTNIKCSDSLQKPIERYTHLDKVFLSTDEYKQIQICYAYEKDTEKDYFDTDSYIPIYCNDSDIIQSSNYKAKYPAHNEAYIISIQNYDPDKSNIKTDDNGDFVGLAAGPNACIKITCNTKNGYVPQNNQCCKTAQ